MTEEQRAAAEDFQTFLLDKPQQLKAMEYGFRPADPAIPLTSPLDTQHGVDPTQPQTVLEVPSADVIAAIQDLWRETKKPVDLVVVMDIRAACRGRRSTRHGPVSCSSSICWMIAIGWRSSSSAPDDDTDPALLLGEKRADVTRRVSGIIEGGDTRLYDAVELAYQELQANGDPSHIRAIVVLSDGADTFSSLPLDALIAQVGNLSEGGNATKIFTIAFGQDASEQVLKQIAESTGGKQYSSDPQSITQVYAEIATFF